MDKRTEEKISQLAFGELSEKEAAELREWAEKQPEGAAVLDAYEAMRSDLRRLRDIPPDQLSEQRLQNAILAGGLKPKPVRTGIPWLWVPSTALTVVLGMFLISRLPSGTEGSIQAGGESSLNAMILNDSDLGLAGKLRGETRGGPEKGMNETGSYTPVVPTMPLPEVTADVERTKRPPAAKVGGGGARLARSARAGSSGRDMAAGARVIPLDAVLDEPASDEGLLVIIQSARDRSTGAQNAVEVSQTEDVIVSS